MFLDYVRSVLVDKLAGLDEPALRRSRLPSGWSPSALVRHLTFVERRWLEWGPRTATPPDPWGGVRDGAPPATLERVLFHLAQEYARRAGPLDVVRELIDGRVGEWDDPQPTTPTVLLHTAMLCGMGLSQSWPRSPRISTELPPRPVIAALPESL